MLPLDLLVPAKATELHISTDDNLNYGALVCGIRNSY